VTLVLASCREDGTNVASTSATGPIEHAPAAYAGSEVCGGCHGDQHTAWKASLHATAARIVQPDTVRASFSGQTVLWGDGARGTVRRVADTFEIETSEPGLQEPTHHRLAIVLGSRVIEQHLAGFPGGRFQALPVAYDLEAEEWFDLFPGDPRGPQDWGHWTGRGMTANSECLFCHTTGFDRGYDAATDGYETSWAELGVGCEACHGPGSLHV
jgi:hypothetical protein